MVRRDCCYRVVYALITALCMAIAVPVGAAVDNFYCEEPQLRVIQHLRKPELMYEVARVSDALDICTRPRAQDGSENFLYTWGHKAKLENMLSMNRLDYCAQDQARLLTNMALHIDRSGAASGAEKARLDNALELVVRDAISNPSQSYYPELQ